MRCLLILAALGGCASFQASAQDAHEQSTLYPAAQNEAPPSAEKRQLIKRFMSASGLQERLDSGSFLERYAFIPELDWMRGRTTVAFGEAIVGPIEALKSVYEKYRADYQEAYESHINWEFTDDELRQMVAFFESAAGQHYLDGTWRMDAYTRTEMEETEEALVREAVVLFQGGAPPAEPAKRDD